jgi:hypothetical protein
VLVVVIGVGGAISFYLPTVLPELSAGLAAISPVLDVLSSSVGELLSVVRASAYAYIIRRTVT